MTDRPDGRITRGTTGPNRLRRFDRWILHLLGPAFRHESAPLAIDLGFGASPRTLRDFASALQSANPNTRAIGVEIDPDRVRTAIDAGLEAVHGGFEIPVAGHPRIIRAANVLRQYDAGQVTPAWRTMCARVADGGWLVEGTCSEDGRLASFLSLDAAAVPRHFTISVRLAELAQPSDVAARLPKILIHRNVPGQPIHAYLRDFDDGWRRAARWGARQRWIQAVEWLRGRDWPIRYEPGRWRLGEVTVAADSVLT